MAQAFFSDPLTRPSLLLVSLRWLLGPGGMSMRNPVTSGSDSPESDRAGVLGCRLGYSWVRVRHARLTQAHVPKRSSFLAAVARES